MVTDREPSTRAERRADVVFALLLTAASCFFLTLISPEHFEVLRQPLIVGYLFCALISGPIAFRRRFPELMGIVQSIAFMTAGIIGAFEPWVTQVSLFVAVFSIGAYARHRRRAFWVRLGIVVAMGVWLAISTYLSYLGPDGEANSFTFTNIMLSVSINIGYFGAAWYFGNRNWSAAIEHTTLAAAQAEIAEQQDQIAGQQLELERMRIARELHDVVAHHVSAMGIHAGAARRVLGTDPDRAASSLRNVEQSARDAIAELRLLVSALRSPDDGDAPQPTLREIDDLVATARTSGQRVALQHVGDPRPAGALAELTLYRVVQEALTNARKHAGPGAAVDIRVRYDPDATEVEISDDGVRSRAAAGSGIDGTGLGLVGMRERVMAVGGTIEAGPQSRGGWLVRARVPLATSLAEPADAAAPPTVEESS